MNISQDLIWWITIFDLPAMAGLFFLIWRTRQDGENAIEQLHALFERRNDYFRSALGEFKLEVAQTYASQGDMRELEARLTAHLLRIEAKLDVTALKAEAAKAKSHRSDT